MKGCDFIKKYYKKIALFMSGLLISCALYCTDICVVSAAYTPSFTQLLDAALNKAGISANLTTLETLKNQYVDGITSVLDGYFLWLPDSGYEDSENALTIYLNQVEPEDNHTFFSYLLEYKGYGHLLDADGSVNPTRVLAYLVATFAIQDDKGDYVVEDKTVEDNKKLFDEMIEEYSGYYYIRSLSVNELFASDFATINDYNNFVSYVKSSEYPTLVMGVSVYTPWSGAFGNVDYYKQIFDNTIPVNYVKDFADGGKTDIYFYDEEGESLNLKFNEDMLGTLWQCPFSDSDSFLEHYDYEDSSKDSCVFYGYTSETNNRIAFAYFFTEDGHKLKIYKSRDSLVNDLAGTDPYHYYINSTYDYSTNNDNSIKISGDYFQDYSQNSYDTITNNTENLNDYSQIDNSITNITNNYYTDNNSGTGSGSGGGSDGSGNDNNNNSGGLSGFLDGIKDIFGSLFSFVGDTVSVISDFLKGITDAIGEFQNVGAGFIFFMSDLFAYVPDVFWDTMDIGLKAVIGIAVYKFFCK